MAVSFICFTIECQLSYSAVIESADHQLALSATLACHSLLVIIRLLIMNWRLGSSWQMSMND